MPFHSALDNIVSVLNQKLDRRKEEWFMAKFFYSLEFQGFQFQIFSILELFSLTILTAMCLKWSQTKLFRWRSKFCREKYSIIPIFVLTLIFIFVMGRQNTLLPLQYVFTPFRIDTAHAGKYFIWEFGDKIKRTYNFRSIIWVTLELS